MSCSCPQVYYSAAITELLNRSADAGTDLWTLDATSTSIFFEYVDAKSTGPVRHQVWFDDENTLSAKYRACRSYGVRGVAMWTAGGLEYGELPASRSRTGRMWSAIPEFTGLMKVANQQVTTALKNDETVDTKKRIDWYTERCGNGGMPDTPAPVTPPSSLPRSLIRGR